MPLGASRFKGSSVRFARGPHLGGHSRGSVSASRTTPGVYVRVCIYAARSSARRMQPSTGAALCWGRPPWPTDGHCGKSDLGVPRPSRRSAVSAMPTMGRWSFQPVAACQGELRHNNFFQLDTSRRVLRAACVPATTAVAQSLCPGRSLQAGGRPPPRPEAAAATLTAKRGVPYGVHWDTRQR